jgi:uncharacterized protein
VAEHRFSLAGRPDDPEARAVMTMVLNNVENFVKYFRGKGEQTAIEVVARGACLNTMGSYTSPAEDRLAALCGNTSVTLSGRGDALAEQSATANKPVGLVRKTHTVPSGIARVVDLQEAGWTFVRP